MIVVADTTPINYLILIQHIGILETMYGHLLIPHAVHEEMLSIQAPPGVRAWAKDPPGWLEILTPATSLRLQIAPLDPGETEAIALAEELQADWLLIDEAAGREEAIRRGLQTIGTLGILREAHRLGLLDLPTELKALEHHGFYISRNLIQRLLNSL